MEVDRGQGTYSELGVGVLVGSAGLFENGGDHVVEVVVSIGVIETFRESVDEDTRVG